MSSNNGEEFENFVKQLKKQQNPSSNPSNFENRVKELNPSRHWRENSVGDSELTFDIFINNSVLFIILLFLLNILLILLSKSYPTYIEFLGTICASLIISAANIVIAINK